jgi:phosphoribosylformimino-5-aminoimidazole carboxamide ribotide isomerase
MTLIPAIDLKDGRCVRLRQGRMEEETVFSDDPVKVAESWVQAGARRLHIVDLDGAFAGQPKNARLIRAIADACPDLPIQVGGGIRNLQTIEAYLAAGVSFAIIGTQAVRDPAFVNQVCQALPGHIMVGLDARDGKIAVEGWAEGSDYGAVELARRFEDAGVSAIVYTDISRDGMMQGVNLVATEQLAEAIAIPVIASGGVSSLDDIRALCALRGAGISGAIIGRALYEGALDLTSAQALADEFCGN